MQEELEHAKRARKMLRERRQPAEPASFDSHIERQHQLWQQIKERLIKDGLYE